jgi:hypothetical protein
MNMHDNKTKVAILGTAGRVSNPASKSVPDLIAEIGDNSGNLVFQKSAGKIVSDEKIFVGRGADVYEDLSRVRNECKAVVFPAANHIDSRIDFTRLAHWLRNMRLPTVILGIGAQANGRTKQDMDLLTKELAVNDGFLELVRVFKEPDFFIGVRGTFTQELLDRFDVAAVVTGCPSLLLNESPVLGQRLQKKYRALLSTLDAGVMLPLAISAASPWLSGQQQKAEVRLVELLLEWHGIYIQQSGGEIAIRTAAQRISTTQEMQADAAWYFERFGQKLSAQQIDRVLKEHIRIFFDTEEWAATLRRYQMCLGTRYHCSALAMQSETPTIMFSHDSRTEELCQSTMIPYLPIDSLLKGSPTSWVSDISFDGEAYDRNRAAMAGKIRAAFTKHGIGCAAHVAEIADTGLPSAVTH